MRSTAAASATVLAAALVVATGATASSAAPADPVEVGGPAASPDAVPFPDAVEPSADLLPSDPPTGAPDPAAMDAPVRAGGPADSAPAQAVDDGPLTGFEQRGGADWTTRAEERAFLSEVDALSDRVSVQQVGSSVEGRRIDLVTISGEPRTQQEIAEGSTILFVCLQHGDEPAGREGCLQGIRDLALDDSPSTGRLLARSTILVIPTVNPDGRVADTRRNANDVDINRDHLVLETPEAQTVARVVRDYRPQVVQDHHEYGGREEVYERDLIRLWPRNLNVDDDVREIAIELSEDYVDPTLQFEGYTTGDYGIFYAPDGTAIAQVAGSEDERIARNMMGLRHAAGQLIESRVQDFDDTDPTDNKLRRVRTQVLSFQAALDLVLEQGSRLVQETQEAREEAAQEGAAGDQPFWFAGADNMLPGADAVTLDPPCAYTLTPEQLDEVRQTLDLHGVETTETDGVVTVSMAQEAQPVIPLLLDERANYELVVAEPVACEAG